MGLGKVNAYSEPILTPTGWVRMGELNVGDQVIGANGKATTVTAIFEQGVVEITRVTFKDGSYSRCHKDHLWNVISAARKQRGSGYRTLTVQQILDQGIRDAAGNAKHYIPMVKPVVFDESMSTGQTIDPYTLGVLLGDGGMSSTSVQVTTDREIIDSMPLPRDVGFTFKEERSRDGLTHQGGLTQMAKYLRPLKLMGTKSNNKFVPNCYKYGSVHDRISVLQGLIDTDGTPVQSRGKAATTIEYGTVSKQLSDDVKFLVQSLGGTVSVKEKTPTYTYKGQKLEGQLFYRMNLSLPGWLVPFRLQRKLDNWTPRSKYEPSRAITTITYDGTEQARCIRVSAEDHLYVTRDFIVTHNTLQTLAVFAAQCVVLDARMKSGKIEPRVPKMILVCPLALKFNWADEIEKFTSFKYTMLDGTPTVRIRQLIEFNEITHAKVLIVNYEQVQKHLGTLNAMNFDLAVFDEAHAMKSPKAARTKACQALLAKRNFMLTGSPMLNQVNDLYVIMDKIQPRKHGSYYTFVNRYCVFGGYKDKSIVGVKNEKELKGYLEQIMVRRLKKDVLDLPEVQTITKKVGLYPEQKKLYDEVVEDMLLTTGSSDGPDAIENALTKFLRLKQICGTTATVLESREDKSEKLDQVVEDVLEVMGNGHKVVVFTQFREVQRCFNARMAAAAPKYPLYSMNGDMPGADRVEYVKQWAAEPGAAAFCGMIQVIGVGLNMTAARHGFFIDKLFVPMLNRQAVDRMHRIGADTTQAIQIFDYLVRGTVESRVETILRNKADVFENIVEKDDWHAKLIAALQAAEEDD
jgi:hypothetical protein